MEHKEINGISVNSYMIDVYAIMNPEVDRKRIANSPFGFSPTFVVFLCCQYTKGLTPAMAVSRWRCLETLRRAGEEQKVIVAKCGTEATC
jgi:hypothetical protein